VEQGDQRGHTELHVAEAQGDPAEDAQGANEDQDHRLADQVRGDHRADHGNHQPITGARAELGEFAPRIETLKIPTDKIREVIGTGGKVIREIVEKTGAKVNIEDDGTVKVASSDGNSIKAAIAWIKSIASDPEVGAMYEGTVVKTADFGAFVNFFGARDGLVHISQLASQRVAKVIDVVKEGDKVKVKLLGFDDRGKVQKVRRLK